MLDPIVDFITMVFHKIGQGIGWVIALILWPFMALRRWYKQRSWIIRGPILLILLALLVGYGFMFYQTQFWRGFDPDYAKGYDFAEKTVVPGSAVPGKAGVCAPSAVIEVAAELTDFNVNQNGWIPSTLLYKAGLFGLDWKYTPWFDNKAAFQLGVNEIVRRTSIEAVDRLGRVRGTSQINQNLQDARQNINYNEDFWYFSLDPFGPKSPTPSSYRAAVKNLRDFNGELSRCEALFDPRADNLLRFLDQMANAIGSTSDILGDQMRASNAGWFDTRADDRFWFTYGQIYALNGIMTAVRSDFGEVIEERGLTKTFITMKQQIRDTLEIDPLIISNGSESAFMMPSHLATMGFYLLRVRANMTEMRDILDR